MLSAAPAAPANFDAAYQAGLQKMQAKQWSAARDAFQQALDAVKDRGKKADAELQIGKCLLAEGDERGAMKAFVNSMRWRYYSASRLRRRAWPAARDEFQRILQVPATRETAETVIFKALAEIGIAQQQRRHGDLDQAEAHYRKALEWLAAPQYTNKRLQRRDLRQAWLGLAEVYADRRDFKAARAALEQLLAVPGMHASQSVRQRLWALCRRAGGLEDLRAKARRVAASSAASPAERVRAQFDVAYSFVYERNYDSARREFEKILSMKGSTPAQRAEAQLYAAHTYFASKRYAQARAEYERVLRLRGAASADAATARARIEAIDALAREGR